MGKPYFRFKQFLVNQDRCAMKVCTDACLFGAWCAAAIQNSKLNMEHILDIGTGTGLLSLMLAQKNSRIIIDAVETDKEAYEQAIENIAAAPWKHQIHVHPASIQQFHFQKKYDSIISNPPFYEAEWPSDNNRKNIALHSTALQLEELLLIIKNNLTPSGIFFLLLPYKRMLEVEKLLQKHNLHLHQKIVVKQSTQHDYFRMMICGGLSDAAEINIKEFSIKDHQQQYTPGFIALLKDYYLYL